MELAAMKREVARRRAEWDRREHLTVEEAFGCFADRLRGTRRGVRSRRQDLIRMFWCWNERRRWIPISQATFPISEVLADFKFVESGEYNRHVAHLFAYLERVLGPRLGDHVPLEAVPLAKRALVGAAEEARLASYAGDYNRVRALQLWNFLFDSTFPRCRTDAGLPLHP